MNKIHPDIQPLFDNLLGMLDEDARSHLTNMCLPNLQYTSDTVKLALKRQSIASLLDAAFYWNNSDQGHPYWCKRYNKLVRLETSIGIKNDGEYES